MWKVLICLGACIVFVVIFERWNAFTTHSEGAVHSQNVSAPVMLNEEGQLRSAQPEPNRATNSFDKSRQLPVTFSSTGAVDSVNHIPPAEWIEIEQAQTEFAKVISMYNAGQISFDDVLEAKKDRLHFLTGLASTYSDISRDKLIDDELTFNKALIEHGRQISAPESQLKFLEDQVRNFEREIQLRATNRLVPD
jgi:hypothetical protein